MAIDINKSTTRVEPPAIALTGRLVDANSGSIADSSTTERITTQDVRQNGLTINNRDEFIFYNNVRVELIPDSKYPGQEYHPKQDVVPYDGVGTSTNMIASGQLETGIFKNKDSNTYYTLNGKDPKRTKNNLYTKPFTIRRNTSGTDNIILKVRTYVIGKVSETRTVDMRVVRHQSSLEA